MADLLDGLDHRIKDYLQNSFKDVGGWCHPHVFVPLQPLMNLIARLVPPDRGRVAEIGVYHGKFFIGLIKMRPPMAGHHAFDVFDQQEFNLDYAGSGDLQKLKDNIAKAGEDPEKVNYVRGDSMALRNVDLERIRDTFGGFSLFSVDGCHMAEHTVNDIRIAMNMTLPEGIIFVDDYYNPNWPGVQEGVAKLYFTDYPKFVPLCYVTNKLFLCHISYHDRYLRVVQEFLATHQPTWATKVVKRFGYDSLSIG